MNAYQLLQNLKNSALIDENLYNQSKKAFEDSYLKNKNYAERLELHRNPSEVKNELLHDLNDYLQQILRRDEMRDIDLEKKSAGYVPVKVAEIWRADKRLASDYEAMQRYCELRSKDFNIIAVHMAEYKSLAELFDNVQQSTYQIPKSSADVEVNPMPVGKTVHPLNFEYLGWEQFEWLVFAYVTRLKTWDKIEWLGQAGGDSGRDIWGVCNGKTYCYQCANYRSLALGKVKGDIDKLVKGNFIPDCFTVVCGGRVSANMRSMINSYVGQFGIQQTAVWNDREFEEKLRVDTPDLIRRFFEGEAFPDVPKNDNETLKLLAECFDRPAFTTAFYREVNIPDFEQAIADTITVLNTGVHRLRDGTFFRNIPSRHQISDVQVKTQVASIYKLVVQLRDTLTRLKQKKEIEPCSCEQIDCPVYFLSENACKQMDRIRQEIFDLFHNIKPDFNLRLE